MSDTYYKIIFKKNNYKSTSTSEEICFRYCVENVSFWPEILKKPGINLSFEKKLLLFWNDGEKVYFSGNPPINIKWPLPLPRVIPFAQSGI